MISAKSCGHVGFEKGSVYEAGTKPESWPQLKGLSLKTESGGLEPGSLLVANISAQGREMPVECRVTEMIEGERLVIGGVSKHAKALLSFEFSEHDQDGGTLVECGLKLKPLTAKARMARPLISKLLEQSVPSFTHDYCRNLERYIKSAKQTA